MSNDHGQDPTIVNFDDYASPPAGKKTAADYPEKTVTGLVRGIADNSPFSPSAEAAAQSAPFNAERFVTLATHDPDTAVHYLHEATAKSVEKGRVHMPPKSRGSFNADNLYQMYLQDYVREVTEFIKSTDGPAASQGVEQALESLPAPQHITDEPFF